MRAHLGFVAVSLFAGLPLFAQFTAGPVLPSSENQRFVADYNNDGLSDVIEGNYVSVNHDGSFEVRLLPGVPDTEAVMAVADFNGDGIVDLVTGPSRRINNGDPGGVFGIYLGDGAGRYARTYTATLGRYVQIADINGDGKDDLIFINGAGAPGSNAAKLTMARSAGDGTFKVTQEVFLSGFPQQPGYVVHAAAADFDHDGNVDLAFRTTTALLVLPGVGNGVFRDVVARYMPYNAGFRDLIAADIDGDGNADLVSVGQDVVRVLIGDGKGRFAHATAVLLIGGWGAQPRNVTVGHFTGTARSDIAAGNNDQIVIYSYQKGELRQVSRMSTGIDRVEVLAGSFRARGNTDLLVTGGTAPPEVFYRAIPPPQIPAQVVSARHRAVSPPVATVVDPSRLTLEVTETSSCGGTLSETWDFEREGMFLRDARPDRTIDAALELGVLSVRLASDLRKWTPLTDYGAIGELEPGHWRGYVTVYKSDCGISSLSIDARTR